MKGKDFGIYFLLSKILLLFVDKGFIYLLVRISHCDIYAFNAVRTWTTDFGRL